MPFDDAQKAEIADIVKSAIGESLGSSLKDALKPIEKKIEKGIEERFAKMKPPAKDPDDGEPDDDAVDEEPPKKGAKAKGGNADAKTAAEIKALRTKIEESEKRAEAAEAARKTESMISKARDLLGKAGITGARAKAALAVLHEADKRLRYDENDVPGLHFKRDGFEEVVPLDKGIEEWLKTEEGLEFLPPKNVQGTGGGAPPRSAVTRDANGQTQIDTKALATKLGVALAGIQAS
jgi:hypothetical protein